MGFCKEKKSRKKNYSRLARSFLSDPFHQHTQDCLLIILIFCSNIPVIFPHGLVLYFLHLCITIDTLPNSLIVPCPIYPKPMSSLFGQLHKYRPSWCAAKQFDKLGSDYRAANCVLHLQQPFNVHSFAGPLLPRLLSYLIRVLPISPLPSFPSSPLLFSLLSRCFNGRPFFLSIGCESNMGVGVLGLKNNTGRVQNARVRLVLKWYHKMG